MPRTCGSWQVREIRGSDEFSDSTAAGGTRFIRPDGVGATFGADGSLAYFGRYK
ncbi:MAG: hypothetical protein AB7I19_02465 [Planctomycetota bacterium]